MNRIMESGDPIKSCIMKKDYTDKSALLVRLSAYTASTGALLMLTHSASGQVVYSGEQNLQLFTPDDPMEIDLDGDGMMDFAFLVGGYSSILSGSGFYYRLNLAYGAVLNARTDNYNSWITGTDTISIYSPYYSATYTEILPIVKTLNLGEPASCSEESWAHISYVSWSGVLGVVYSQFLSGIYGTHSSGFSGGDFVGQEKFMGARFHIGEDQHYAWIRLGMDEELDTLTIVDWAYESTPGKVILAGDGLGEDLPPWIQIKGAEISSDPLTSLTLLATEEIVGLDSTDISVTNGELSHFTVVTAGLEYTLDVMAAAEGQITLTIPAGAAEDLTGNENSAISKSWEYDITSPDIFIDLHGSEYVNYHWQYGAIVFSEPVTELDPNKLVISNGYLTYFEYYSTSGDNYYFEIYTENEGIATLQVPAGAVMDRAGNPNTSAYAEWYYDATFPVVNLDVGFDVTSDQEVDVAITFTEAVTDLQYDDFTFTNGTPEDLVTNNEADYTLTVHATEPGIVIVNLREYSVWDNAFNGNEAASVAWLYDPVDFVPSDAAQPLVIFPNPASDYVEIRSARAVDLDLFNAQGNLILTRKGVLEERISVADLNPGVYLIRIQDKENIYYRKLLVN